MAKRQRQVGGRKEAPLAVVGSEAIASVELSPLETLLQGHPDLTIIRREIFRDVGIIQQLTNTHWRLIDINVEQEKDGQKLFPTIVVSGVNTPANTFFTSDLALEQHRYGLVTSIRVHTEDDKQVHAAVEYKKGSPFPPDIHSYHKLLVELHARPIPTYELVTIARSGLEMLEAYTNAPEEGRMRIYNMRNGAFRKPQVAVNLRPNLDAYIAEASPILARIMQNKGISYNNASEREIFALNALQQVTKEMLPATVPSVSRRTRPPGR